MGKILTIIAVLLMLLAAACNTSGCLDNGSAIPRAGFYASADGSAATLDSLEIGGVDAPADSLVLKAGTAASEVYLPMPPQSTSVQWAIAYRYRRLDSPALNDTISMTYESIPYFASEECGAMYVYRLTGLRHTSHLIDSITVADSLITNVDRTSLQIYFCIATEGDER